MSALRDLMVGGLGELEAEDPTLHGFLEQEYQRQMGTLSLIAASSLAPASVLACQGTPTGNVTTEGYPGARYHAGCEVVDRIEQLAIERAKAAFAAKYANVQPHSGSSANQIVMCALLQPGDTILGLDLDCGGHLTHGAKASMSGQYFRSVSYGLNETGRIDYDRMRVVARECKPRLVFCGASAYPRTIDFEYFRRVADEVGAFVLADISHIAGLVAAGEHDSPIDHAHFTTTSTYKQLNGPRGGLILMGRDHDRPGPDGQRTLADLLQRAVFPYFQGTPNLAGIAAKARALAFVASPQFKGLARRIVQLASVLGSSMASRGYRVLTGGTDNHMVLVNVFERGLTGAVAERALEECSMIINKNRIPGDGKPATVTSGIRLGSNTVALRGMDEAAVDQAVALLDRVLTAVVPRGDRDYQLDAEVRASVQRSVAELCARYPIPGYPLRA